MSQILQDVNELAIQIAEIHNQSVDINEGQLLDGRHLHLRGCAANMPFYENIEKALERIDSMISCVTKSTLKPYVKLWNEHKTGTAYGNPSWDLGMVIHRLYNSEKAEMFLRKYLDHQGVRITIIELYSGILYAKLNDAIETHNEAEWERISQNECDNICQGRGLAFIEISAEALARLGMPGVSRVICF